MCFWGFSREFSGISCPAEGIEVDKNKAKAIREVPALTCEQELQSFMGKVNFIRRFVSNLAEKSHVFSELLKSMNREEFKWEEQHQRDFDTIKDYLSKPPYNDSSSEE